MLRFLLVSLLLLTTACSSSIVQLRKIDPQGTPYQNQLAKQYLDFAEAEAKQYDWYNSGYFAKKGLKAAKAQETAPEDLQVWHINEDALPTLTQARHYLDTTLTDNMKANHPKEAAEAQFMFDCWVEQQSEDWQTSHIAYCREHFYNTLDKLYAFAESDQEAMSAKIPAVQQSLSKDLIKIPDDAPVNGPASLSMRMSDNPSIKLSDYASHGANGQVCPEGCNRTIEKRTLYFDFNSSNLNNRTQLVLKSLADKLKVTKDYEITLNGYADRVGKEDYNMELSKKRAKSVKKKLIALGIDEKNIVIYAFGELHGLIETKDGVPEKENRAVQIVLDMQ